jgi:hypothetical protein
MEKKNRGAVELSLSIVDLHPLFRFMAGILKKTEPFSINFQVVFI